MAQKSAVVIDRQGNKRWGTFEEIPRKGESIKYRDELYKVVEVIHLSNGHPEVHVKKK